MRSLSKLPEPDVLQRHGQRWTDEYTGATSPAERKSRERWRHAEVKAALSEETAFKCAYCESQIADVAYPHVEHIIPKTAHPELAHLWENLTLACPKCNVKKDDLYDENDPILNPYRDNISNHLYFHGDFVDYYLGNRRGKLTILACDLNRMELVYSRLKRLQEIALMLDQWHQESGAMKSAIRTAIELEANEGEYTAAVAAYLTSKGFFKD